MMNRLRMAEWLLLAALLLSVIAYVAPAQIAVVIYKVALVTLFAHIGYWIVRRTAGMSEPDPTAAAIIMAAVILAGAMAL